MSATFVFIFDKQCLLKDNFASFQCITRCAFTFQKRDLEKNKPTKSIVKLREKLRKTDIPGFSEEEAGVRLFHQALSCITIIKQFLLPYTVKKTVFSSINTTVV